MGLRGWAIALVPCMVAALASVLLGGSVAPCLGGPAASGDCVAAWQATRPIWPDRLQDALGWPGLAVLTFAAGLLIALGVDVAVRGLRRPRTAPAAR
jgi:hypothetical protein